MVMIIESKVIAVILFIVGCFFLLCGLMVLYGVRSIDKEDRILFGVVLFLSFIFGYSLIIGGIQLWQI